MWTPDLESDEPDDAGVDILREIPLAGGRRIYVMAEVHPMLMEWEWQYDDLTAQAVRIEDGRKRSLYQEQLRWYYRRRSHASAPVLERPAIRATFGHLAGFRRLLGYSQNQREFALMELGVNLPLSTEILGLGLSIALLHYYEWQAATDHWTFTPDPAQLTPGTLERHASGDRGYERLGDFLHGEYTGEWVRSRKSATGLVPETYAKRLQRAVFRVWREAAEIENFDEVEAKDIEVALRHGKRPAFLTVRHICDLIEHYRLDS